MTIAKYYQITKGDTPDPSGDNRWYIMTNLEGKIQLVVAQLYSLRKQRMPLILELWKFREQQQGVTTPSTALRTGIAQVQAG